MFFMLHTTIQSKTPQVKKIREVEEQRKQKEMGIIEEFKKNQNPKKEEWVFDFNRQLLYFSILPTH